VNGVKPVSAIDQKKLLNDTVRCNESRNASYNSADLSHPFAEGSFRYVAKGQYTDGPRRGTHSVCKWFKQGQVYEHTFFTKDINAVDKAITIIQQFNLLRIIDKTIKINKPEVWTFTPSSGSWGGRMVLQEPYIKNYQKFNSNTGWTTNSANWSRIMQALSHFSYHISSGQNVLCDLQGGVYSDGVVLSDPVILSRQRIYGLTDLGPKGISTFFSRHVCNEYCKSTWQKPRECIAYFEEQEGSSMILIPTVKGREKLSRRQIETIAEYDSDYDSDA
jgi:hypothetical protein